MTSTGNSMVPYRDPLGGAPVGDDPRRCTAKSTRSGERCRKWAVEGHHVCPTHGGKTPGAKRIAQLRLLDLVGPATEKLEKILVETQDERVALKAVEMIYDRTGLEAKSGSVDATLARELLLQRLMEAKGERQPTTLENLTQSAASDEDEVFDVEVVEDDDDTSYEDLL